jgi:molybdate transport repressor ModE-like protein
MIANLTLIQTFYVVAQEGSYSAASRTLGISYQSATNHVRRLEQLVGDRLIESEKGSRNIELTSRGLTLYKLLNPELEAMLKRLIEIINKERPVLRIGLPSSAFFYLLPDIILRMQEMHPDIEIQAVERDTVLQELVLDGSIDICISESFYGNPILTQRLLGTYSLSLIYPEEWPAPPDDSGRLSDWLANRPFVTYEPGQSIRSVALDYLLQCNVEPQIAISTSSSMNINRCVEHGLGYSIIPSWCAWRKQQGIGSIELERSTNMKLYFGYAQYLERNVYVNALYNACKEFLSKDSIEIRS